MLIKTPLPHQSLGPHVFFSFFPSFLPPSLPLSFLPFFLFFFLSLYLSLSFSLSFFLSSLSFWLIPRSAEARWAHRLARVSKTLSRRRPVPSPPREGTRCLPAAAQALKNRALLAFRVNQGISASFSLLLSYVDSGSPGSGPLKDQHPAMLTYLKLLGHIFLLLLFCLGF